MQFLPPPFLRKKTMKKRVYAGTIVVAVAAMTLLFTITSRADTVEIGIGPEGSVRGFREITKLTEQGLSKAQQECLWEHAKAHGKDDEGTMEIFTFYVSTVAAESGFNCNAYNDSNENGTCDRGPGQVNSVNVPGLKKAGIIEDALDLYDPIKGINAMVYMMDPYIRKYGVSEKASYHYINGPAAKGKSSQKSRSEWATYKKYAKLLMGREL